MRTLGTAAAEGADARQIADTAVQIWRAVDEALTPVIGARGSSALYKRGIHLARAEFVWLDSAYENAAGPGDFGALRTALSGQDATTAAAAHDAMLRTFLDLLADLIGRSLTQRLLQSVWESPSSGNAAQDDRP